MYRRNTYQVGLVEVVVYRPGLDDGERMKREENLKRVIASCGKSMMKNRKGDSA